MSELLCRDLACPAISHEVDAAKYEVISIGPRKYALLHRHERRPEVQP